MSGQILEKLFDSPIKARLLKLFLRNEKAVFSVDEATQKIQASRTATLKQIRMLEDIGLLSLRQKKNKEGKNVSVYGVNPSFEFYSELCSLVLKSSPASKEKMSERLKNLGKIKMALIGGVFLNQDNGRVDLFLVGNKIEERKLREFLKQLEAEVGKEINYSFMEIDEFNYRYTMFDRFVLDVLEQPHEMLIDKLQLIK